MAYPEPQLFGFYDLGVAVFYGGGKGELGGSGVYAGAVLRINFNTKLLKRGLHFQVAAPVEIPVGAADGAAFHGRHLGQRAHPDAADA